MASARKVFTGADVGCVRGGRVLFSGLAFALNPGEALQLAGPNGAGKSSLLRIMLGALPSSGKIQWDGEDFLENGIETHGRRIAYLPPDDRSLKPTETVAESLSFWAGVWGASPAVLDDVGLAHVSPLPVKHLSAGQKRRLSFARVLMKKSPLWLLDEPLNGLDTIARATFFSLLAQHTAAGGMAVIASHDDIGVQKLEVGG